MSKNETFDGTFLTLAAVGTLAAIGKRGWGPGITRGSKSRSRGWYNIPDAVFDYAEKKGLTAVATGGNIDYMAKHLGGDVWAVLGSYEDAGSPDSLEEPANINIFLDEGWQRIIILPFKTAREAIEHMGTMLSINL